MKSSPLLLLAVFATLLCFAATIDIQSKLEGIQNPTPSSPLDIWQPVDDVLLKYIADDTFPGAVAYIADKSGPLYTSAKGYFTYGDPAPKSPIANPQVTTSTMYDMASCTKVLGTTNAMAQFYQRGEVNLETRVVDILGAQFGANGKENITLLNLLLHNSGFPGDPTPYWYNTPEFGCPETSDFYPNLTFSCQTMIFNALMNQTLENPVGAVYVYSDLNFMTLEVVVGRLARTFNKVAEADLVPGCDIGGPWVDQCYGEAYIRKYIFDALGLSNMGYLPNEELWSICAPTLNDTTYRHIVTQGVVEDPNAYAMGGISGHAGIFANAIEIHTLINRILFAGPSDSFMNSSTVAFFTKEYNHTQSSRAIGWNTNDYTANDRGWNQSCGSLSQRTFMHIGYTGTMICADPDRGLIVIMLTNRVYPDDPSTAIHNARQEFSTVVQTIYDKYYNSA
eukprot:TRINITY_DN9913_c0_g1_i1.p1 TRINITY_DN9913_c0_g1~~TRINITY_DN9913_c0_g1_i1.p1  ORF type:complete len:451 (-),score=132.88 TRINITY_DN9913_c0_g1_i1:186-1538(-)